MGGLLRVMRLDNLFFQYWFCHKFCLQKFLRKDYEASNFKTFIVARPSCVAVSCRQRFVWAHESFDFYTRVDGKRDVTFNIEFLKLDYNKASNINIGDLLEVKGLRQ